MDIDSHLAADVLDLCPEAGDLPHAVRDLPRGQALHNLVQLSEALKIEKKKFVKKLILTKSSFTFSRFAPKSARQRSRSLPVIFLSLFFEIFWPHI